MKRYIAAGVIATGLAIAPSAPAQANIYCGKWITKSVSLKRDLFCERNGGDGLNIGADNVTIDLNGHAIVGNEDLTAGINSMGHRNVTIRDGVIMGFYNGIVLDAPKNFTLKRLALCGDGDGLWVRGPGSLRVRYSKLYRGSEGAFLVDPFAPAPKVSWYKSRAFEDTSCPYNYSWGNSVTYVG